MSADDAAQYMHSRLHAGATRLRRLPDITADAPSSLSNGTFQGYEACTEANATRLPHTSQLYKSFYPGRLIHADIAGLFLRSHSNAYQYALVLVDDHTRFKSVYLLRRKSEAPQAVRAFISSFTALLNRNRKDGATNIVATFHSDNAGEFLSSEFASFLNENVINATTCPPHVHQLNGVAERAIRSIMDLTRAAVVSSAAPHTFWDYAIMHAVHILKCAMGPPNSSQSSYEPLTGDKPRVMSILPFGCRAFAVKPRHAYSKTRMETRAWVGANLGRSISTP
eukprot:2697026-Pleurochrysis_carterae.AAC.1